MKKAVLGKGKIMYETPGTSEHVGRIDASRTGSQTAKEKYGTRQNWQVGRDHIT